MFRPMTVLQKVFVLFAFLATGALVFRLPVPAFAAEKQIRIGVAVNETRGTLSSSGTMNFRDADGKNLSLKGSVPLSIDRSGNSVIVGKASLRLPVEVTGARLLRWGNHPYRGTLRLVRGRKGFTVVNILGVENYLRGVLKMEVNPAWEFEVLKAQAIVARTYALRNLGKHGSEGYDLCALPHCQVYRGVNAEDARLTKAIEATKGIVVSTGSGELAFTPYHADSGGYTANVADVWGGNIPYLASRPEPFDYESPYSNWQVSLGLQEIEEALKPRGLNVGNVTEIRVLSTDRAGRAVYVGIVGDRGRAKMKASHFRMALGSSKIKSTFFTIESSRPTRLQNEGIPLPEGDGPALTTTYDERALTAMIERGVFSSDEMMDMLLNPGKRGDYLRLALKRQSGVRPEKQVAQVAPKGVSSGNVTIRGKGWGHGVGMSQWGAKKMAEEGWDYRKIIAHYYPTTQLKRLYR
ncbi:MAG: SpoIID/LytB domain-containing protein [Thermovirgaceae bacterium]